MNYGEIYENKLNEYEQEIKAIKAKMMEDGKKNFQDSMKIYFVRNPKVLGVAWTQYTPYFNDGEACEFYTNEPYPITQEVLDELQLDNPFEISSPYDVEDVEEVYYSPEKRELEYIFGKIPDEVFEMVFGDHAMIIMDRQKIDVQEYDHD